MKRCAALFVLLLAGCASTNSEPVAVAAAAPPAPAAASTPLPAYELTKQEKALDCRRLTGRIKLRAAAMRTAAPKPSFVSSTIQTVATPVFGGSKRSIDPEADYRADRAQLEAFNRRLAELKCPTVDLDAELAARPAAAPKPAVAPGAAKAGQ